MQAETRNSIARKIFQKFHQKMNRSNTNDFIDALFLHTSYFVVVVCEVCSILNSNDSHVVVFLLFFTSFHVFIANSLHYPSSFCFFYIRPTFVHSEIRDSYRVPHSLSHMNIVSQWWTTFLDEGYKFLREEVKQYSLAAAFRSILLEMKKKTSKVVTNGYENHFRNVPLDFG